MNQKKEIAKMLSALLDNDYTAAKKHLETVVSEKLTQKIAAANAKEDEKEKKLNEARGPYEPEAKFGSYESDFDFDEPKDERSLDDVTTGTYDAHQAARANKQNPRLYKLLRTLHSAHAAIEALPEVVNPAKAVAVLTSKLANSYEFTNDWRDGDEHVVYTGNFHNGGEHAVKHNILSWIEARKNDITRQLGINNSEEEEFDDKLDREGTYDAKVYLANLDGNARKQTIKAMRPRS